MRRSIPSLLIVASLLLAVFALPAIAVAGADGGSVDLHAQVLARAADAPATVASVSERHRDTSQRLALQAMAAVVAILLVAAAPPRTSGRRVTSVEVPSTSTVGRHPASRRGPPILA